MDLHHPILREFPEHRDTIRRLQTSDHHFRHLYDEYHRLDADQEIDERKMRRAKLKDYIYHLVKHAPAAAAR